MSSGVIECKAVLLGLGKYGSQLIITLHLASTIPTRRRSCTIPSNPLISEERICNHGSESKKERREMCLQQLTIPWSHLDRTSSSRPSERNRNSSPWILIHLLLSILRVMILWNPNTITWWPARARDLFNKVATCKTTPILQNTKKLTNLAKMLQNSQ